MADRVVVYPGQIPLETDLLNTNRNVMEGIGLLIADVLGTATNAAGLACTPTSPATLNVMVGAGRLYSNQNVDNTAYSSLAAVTNELIVKQGILRQAVTLACAAPSTSGYSINYLIEAAFVESDTGSVVLPYYDVTNPQQAFSGPGGLGASNFTVRACGISLQAKAGIAAATGTQATPAADSGYVGLYVVTVAQGQATITSGNIAKYSGAPFLTETLGQKISSTTANGLYTPIYSTGTFAPTYTGFGTPPAGTASWVKVGPVAWLQLPSSNGISNATGYGVTNLPVAIQSALAAQSVSAGAFIDNSVSVTGVNAFITGATMNLSLGGITNGWTGSGNKGSQGAIIPIRLV